MEYCRIHNQWFDEEFEDCPDCENDFIKKSTKNKKIIKFKDEEGQNENCRRKKKKKRQKTQKETYPGEGRWETDIR